MKQKRNKKLPKTTAARRFTLTLKAISLIIALIESTMTKKVVQRINQVKLNKSSRDTQNRLPITTKSRLYSGTLTENVINKFQKLEFTFKLIRQDDISYESGYKIFLSIEVEPSKISKDDYSDSFSEIDQKRVTLKIHQKKWYHWGMEPHYHHREAYIKNLSLTFHPKKGEKTQQKGLIEGSLERLESTIVLPDYRTPQIIHIEYQKTKNWLYSRNDNWYSFHMPRLPTFIFYYTVVVIVNAMAGMTIAHFSSESGMVTYLSPKSHDVFLFRHLYTFYKAQYLMLCSFTYLYSSVFSTVLIFILLLMELITPLFFIFGILGHWGRLLPFRSDGVGISVFFILYDTMETIISIAKGHRRHNPLPHSNIPNMKKNQIGLVLVIILGMNTLINTRLIIDSVGYGLLSSLLYCTILIDYTNPNLMDYLAWLMFSFYSVFYYVSVVVIFKAIALKGCFMEPFFETWFKIFWWKMRSEFFWAFVVFGVLVGVDFLVFKSNWMDCFKKVEKLELGRDGKILVDEAGDRVDKTQPAVMQMRKQSEGMRMHWEGLKFANPLLGGNYSFEISGDMTLKFRQLKNQSHSNWEFRKAKNTQNISKWLVHKIWISGKIRQELVAFVQKVKEKGEGRLAARDTHVEIILFNLRKLKILKVIKTKGNNRFFPMLNRSPSDVLLQFDKNFKIRFFGFHLSKSGSFVQVFEMVPSVSRENNPMLFGDSLCHTLALDQPNVNIEPEIVEKLSCELKLSPSGEELLVLYTVKWWKNKIYTIRQNKIFWYSHQMMVLKATRKEDGDDQYLILHAINNFSSFLLKYYRNSRISQIEYLAESAICVFLEDHLILIEALSDQDSLPRTKRIDFCTRRSPKLTFDSNILVGSCKDYYYFVEGLSVHDPNKKKKNDEKLGYQQFSTKFFLKKRLIFDAFQQILSTMDLQDTSAAVGFDRFEKGQIPKIHLEAARDRNTGSRSPKKLMRERGSSPSKRLSTIQMSGSSQPLESRRPLQSSRAAHDGWFELGDLQHNDLDVHLMRNQD